MKRLKRIILALVIVSMLACFNLNGLIASAASVDTSASIKVDGDLSISEGAVPYVPTAKDLAMKQRKIKDLTDKLKSSNKNGIGIMTMSRILSVPVFQQINGHYCGPATVKEVLHYYNGTSSAQTTYGSELGTSDDGTTMTNIPGVLNNHQSQNLYLYSSFSSYNDWKNMVFLDIGNSRPVVIDITSTTSNWTYATSGHYMCISGYDDNGSTAYEWVADPHPTYYGAYMYTANAVYTVNNAHWRHAVVW